MRLQVRAYLRVSTEEQAEEGFSIPAQRQRLADFCRSQWGGAARVTWYVDDGQSARDLERPALSRLRAELAQGDVIMVLRLDRLTRSVFDLYTLLREWDDRGVFFRSVTEPYDTTSTEGRFMIGLLALLAEWERLRIAERVREVMAHTVREEGRHLSRPPLGYELENGRLVVNQAEARLVEELFSRYAAGQGIRTIARKLNRQGQRTKQRREWTDFTVAYVLRNPVYTGKVAWGRIVHRGKRQTEPEHGEVILADGTHPPLVDPRTWERVQQRLAERRQHPTRAGTGTHPLSGLARCGLCGGPVHGLTQQRCKAGQPQPGRERHYYRCANRVRKGSCRLPYLPAERLEEQVLRRVGPLGSREALEAVAAWFLKSLTAEQDPVAVERHELQRRLSRWDHAYEAGDLTREEWRERTRSLRRRQEELDRILHRADCEVADGPARRAGIHPADVARSLEDLPALWARLTPEERRIALHGLVTEIIVYPDGQVTLTPRSYSGHLGVIPPVAFGPANGTP